MKGIRAQKAEKNIIGFIGFVLYLCFVYLNPQEFIPFLKPLRPALLIASFTFIVSLLSIRNFGDLFNYTQTKLLFFLLLLVSLSMIFSIDFVRSKSAWGFFFRAFFLYMLVIMVISEREIFRKTVWIMIILLFINATISFYQYKQGLMGYRLRSFDKHGGANDYALLLICMIPFGTYFIENVKSKLPKSFAIVAVLAFLTCLTRTRSRMGFLGLIVYLGQLIYLKRKNRALVLIVLGAVALTLVRTHHGYFDRIRGIDSNAARSSRLELWQEGFDIMMLKPFFGVGPGNITIAKAKYVITDNIRNWDYVSHNAFLDLGAENGIIALITYISIFIVSIRQLIVAEKRFKNKDLELQNLCNVVRMAYVTLFFSMIFLSQQYNPFYYMFAAMSAVLHNFSLEYEPKLNNAAISQKKFRYKDCTQAKMIRSN